MNKNDRAASMNFLLRKLESQVDEENLLEGEMLLEKGAVAALQEVERHLWVARIDDGEGYEVEVKISPARVTAGTCECERFRTNGECPHFVATLLALRKKIRRQRETKRRQQKRKVKSKKLTTALVLENVEHEDLVDFIKEYARTHRNFNIALKARFTTNVETIGTREKFLQLLESTISLARRPDRSITQRGLQKILKVINELQEQAREAIVQEHFAEAFYIAQSIIEKIPPILSKVTAHPGTLKSEVIKSFETLSSLSTANLPPALLSSIRNYCLNECHKLAYRKHKIDRYFFQLLFEIAEEARHVDRLLQALEVQQEKYEDEFRKDTALLLLKLQLLEKSGRHDQAQALIEHNLLQSGILQHAVDQAIRRGNLARAKQLAHQGLAANLPPAVANMLEDKLLTIAEQEQDKETLRRILVRRFLQTLHLKHYHRLTEAMEEDLPGLRGELIDRLRHRPPSLQQREALAFLLAEAGMTDALFEHLQQNRSLHLLQRYDELLLPQKEEELLQLYRDLLTDYIQHHLGPKSSRKIRQTLDHLQEIGMKTLAERLVQEFRTSYPERHTLMDELSLF